ncbi:MAG: hypothetical protein IJN66_00165 [Muribaculaceae bacterium]|nr:hypothetical protein [Muribaculaceae bacterium]
MKKFEESLKIEDNIFELKENCIIEYLVHYFAPCTGWNEHEMPAGTKFCLDGIMRDDAMYMHSIDNDSIDNDIDFYEILSEKEKRRNPKMSRRLGGFTFFITEKQIEELPIHFISGSKERSLEILKLYRQKIGITE